MSFSPKQFRQSLLDSSKLTKNFDKYLTECKKNNVQVIYYIIEEFQKILVDKQSLVSKVNAIFAIQLCLQTCEYPFIEMTEAFLLPVLQEVVLYMADKRTYAKTSQFFKDKGYPASTPNIEQLSHNFVNLSTNLIFLASKIKENYYFFMDKLKMESAFKQLAVKLVKKGNQISSSIEQKGQELNEIYEQKLAQFQNFEEEYVQFFKQKIQKYLLQGGKGRQYLDIRKLLKNLDSWLTSQIIGSLHDALQNSNFQVRRHALGLLNQIFIWGDIEAIMVLNQGESIEHIYERIVEVKGSSDLGRGGQIYPEINGQLQNKKNFYIEFLRCLETWSRLVPTTIYLTTEEDSKILTIYRKLKDRNFIFPNNDIHAKFKKQFDENMKKNEERNNYIVLQLNENGNSQKSRSYATNRLSKYFNKISLIKEMRESTILSLHEIQKLIEQCQITLKNLNQNERKLTKNMKIFNYFSSQFQKKFSMIEQDITQSKLEFLYERGYKCLQKIQQLGPHYKDYQNGGVTFKEFGEAINGIFKKIDKTKSNISGALSKLMSKSKHSISRNSLSRSGLQLSKSLNIKAKEPDKPWKIKEKLQKEDFILEKSNDKSPKFNQSSKSINQVKNKSQYQSQMKNQKKYNQNNREKKAKVEENSMSQVSNSMNKQNSLQKRIQNVSSSNNNSKQSMQKKSNDQKKSQRSSNLNKPRKQKASILKKQKSSVDNRRQIASPAHKKVQQFSNDSWSESQSQQKIQKRQQKLKEYKQKIKSPQKQIFEASSFSNYDEEHEEIRDAISKQQNPSFKMVFKDKSSSKVSKSSKHQKSMQSNQYCLAVLQSLAPRSINQGRHKQISNMSREKQGIKYPPKSSKIQTGSKISNKLYLDTNQFNKSKQSRMVFQDSSFNDPTQTYDYKMKMNKQEDSSNSMIRHEQSKSNSRSKLRPFQIVEESSSENYSNRSKKQIQTYRISSKLKESNSSNKIKSISSNEESHKSTHLKGDLNKYKMFQVNSGGVKVQNLNSNSNNRVRQDKDLQKLQQVKAHKLFQIKRLQQKIVKLKEQSYKMETRTNWQSPHRGISIRTGISPRFRNNTLTNHTESDNYEEMMNTNRQEFCYKKRKNDEMNFNVVELFKLPQGRLIYSRLYKKQLSQLNIKEKRKILKGKDLVFRNDDLEIGLLIHRQAKDLKIIYYITANRFIKTFLYKIEQTSKLAINAIPNEILHLQPKKQYRIYIFSEILEFPYKMPNIIFKYHPELMSVEEKLFIKNQINLITSLIPIFFIKFISMNQITYDYYQQAWKSPTNLLRGQEIAYSIKILPKHFYILQYFPEMINLQTKDYESVYAVQCEFGSTKFILRMVLKINKFMYIQGLLTHFRQKANSQKILQYTICCINQLLSKTNKDLLI